MSRQHSPGLYQRNGIWHIDKQIKGYGRLSESTGERDIALAEERLAARLVEIKAGLQGIRIERTFEEAAVRYLRELQTDAERAIYTLDACMPYLGHLLLRQVHAGTVQPYVDARLNSGVSPGTINRDICVIRRILNLSARMWRDDQGRPWLDTAPLIPMVPHRNPKRSYVLTWDEQERFVAGLPPYLQRAVLLAVNCGAREDELCSLRWEWATRYPHNGREYTLFVLSASGTKTKKERVLIPNRAAQNVLRELRELDTPTVLSQRGRKLGRLSGHAWERAWAAAGLPTGDGWRHGPHNLRHTFGHRLRAAGVSLEYRQDLLGHEGGRGITTHYSETEISALITAADAALETRLAAPLRIVTQNSRKDSASS